MTQEKTHYDYIRAIGETRYTARNYLEKCWNRYYFKTYSYVLDKMLGDVTGRSVLDVGTSHGAWFEFFKRKQFSAIYGAEIDSGRAKLAKACGYDEIYNCDASMVPIKACTIDYAVSNDVFVHILRLEDKIAVLKKMEDILKPGGAFIFNHPVSRAFGYKNYKVDGSCSFLSLQELIAMVTKNTGFEIDDIKPTFFKFRNMRRNFFCRSLKYLMIMMPFGSDILFLADYINSRKSGMQDSDTIYLKLVKK
ncbi:MAG: methyltransferase domain-containing protein [Candidatus Omnitrophota bacterium]